MANDINGLPPSHVSPQDSGQAKQRQNNPAERSGGQGAQPAQSGGEQVSLTETGTRLSRLDQSFSDAPVVDGERVEGIKQAVNTGSYSVDPGRVADRMMGLERALYGGSGS